jgi:hypothetical protein
LALLTRVFGIYAVQALWRRQKIRPRVRLHMTHEIMESMKYFDRHCDYVIAHGGVHVLVCVAQIRHAARYYMFVDEVSLRCVGRQRVQHNPLHYHNVAGEPALVDDMPTVHSIGGIEYEQRFHQLIEMSNFIARGYGVDPRAKREQVEVYNKHAARFEVLELASRLQVCAYIAFANLKCV